nr:NADH dehydrogenase subunit 6 [Saemundssonia lari]
MLLMVMLGLFWSCSSPSVGLLTALAITLSWSGYTYLTSLVELPLFILNLVVVGGLFVLTSFVILTYPEDYDVVFQDFTPIFQCGLIGFFGVMVMGAEGVGVYTSSGSGMYLLIFLFILLKLLCSLFAIHSFLYEGEESFSST